uniref:NADH-quinone oxidoreductase n=1 Tax=Candidatus Kentrum sp. MB TaxID=2138164 RepID=A0A450XHJ0_9GAMM|nr:MAG: NADH-quinone oxidoreductase subunit G [Candidatus Kentron sp. MB]VFK33299.1 MAG: NADH-quinone oxidoreductase subunit G [Candidatus Kentron sp. MB]VFK76089.1 MAG: NADH-quinone oxidoreductase subunit G [Candidatus Kentron sp. MB]
MSDQLVSIEIDGIPLQARQGDFLIDVADAAGVAIPRFCYHERLSVAANCRMCLVEVEKIPKPLPACATPVTEGMRVHTRSPMVLAAQKAVMEFLLINHPLDCPICDQGGECELQDISVGFGGDTSRFQESKRVVRSKNLGPLVAADMTRCIHCTRCVRFGEEIAGQRELGAIGRGENVEIGTFIEKTLDSELSGNIIDLCPVGALTSKPFRYRARAWEMQQVSGVAFHDVVGSNLYFHVKDDRVMRVVPRENEEINEVWISDRDRFSYQGLYSEDRLHTPMVKRNGKWQSVDWETALFAVVEGLQRIVRDDGPNAIGALASPGATLEEFYLFQKVLRGLECHNIDHRIRTQDFRNQARAPLFPWLGQSMKELEESDVVLLVGSNCRKEQPLINHRIRRAALRGARIFVLNPIDYPFNYSLAGRLIVPPMRMVTHLSGIARFLAIKGDSNNSRTSGFEKLFGDIGFGEIEREIAEALQTGARTTVLLGNTAEIHPQSATLQALVGYIASYTNSTLGTLSVGANSAGAWIAGALPHRGPAGKSSEKEGLDAYAMVADACKGYMLLGMEPELDCANSHLALEAMAKAGFVVSLTAYRTKVMEDYADVLLPMALFAENTGTFVNASGAWQDFSAVVASAGDAKPAWKILHDLGRLLGLSGFEYSNVTQIRDELRTLMRDVNFQEQKDAWASYELDEKDEKIVDGQINGQEFMRIGDVSIYAVDSLVRRAKSLQETADALECTLRVNNKLAEALNIKERDSVSITQDGYRKTLSASIDGRVPDGCVWLSTGIAGSVGLGSGFGPVSLEAFRE